MYLDPGFPLTDEEAEHVMGHLEVSVRSAKGDWSANTPGFIRALGWPQRRMPDVRGFLERDLTRAELSKRLGDSVQQIFMSRTMVWVNMGEPKPPKPEEKLEPLNVSELTGPQLVVEFERAMAELSVRGLATQGFYRGAWSIRYELLRATLLERLAKVDRKV